MASPAAFDRALRPLHERCGCSARHLAPCSSRSAPNRTLCRAKHDAPSGRPERPLFLLDGRSSHMSLNMSDIMDAYEVCSLIPSADERQQCYSVFGLDASRMNAYYDTVLSLEQQLASDLHGTGRGVALSPADPDDYLHAPAECSMSEW